MKYELNSNSKQAATWFWSRLGAALLTAAAAATSPAATPVGLSPHPPHHASLVPADTLLSWNVDLFELIANGGFESGGVAGWTLATDGFGSYVLNTGTYDPQGPEIPSPPLNGTASVLSEPMSPGVYVISQDVTIPASVSSAILRWSDRIRNFEFDGTFSNDPQLMHTFRVEVRNLAGNVQAVLFSTEPGDTALADWQKRQADLSAFRGQTIRLAFVTYVQLFFFNVHLDNISLLATLTNGVTTEVYFGTNSSLGAAQLLGQTTNAHWDLPALQPATSYFWQLVHRLGSAVYTSPVWDFQTAPLGPLHHFTWAPITSPQIAQGAFQVTVTARDRFENVLSNYQGSATLSFGALLSEPAAPPSRNLLGSPAFTASTVFDRATTGYSLTPNRDLWVDGARCFSGQQWSLWTDSGLAVASQSVATPAGSWSSTRLERPVPLLSGRTYRLGSYAAGVSAHYANFDLPGAFTDGTIHQSYTGSGWGFPSDPHPARWWLVDLDYHLQTPQSLPDMPAQVIQFSNGSWTAPLALPAPTTNVVLRMDNLLGTAGIAGLFDVLPSSDTDGDGLPDDWETLYDLDPNNAGDAGLDQDSDGLTNGEEFQAGTNPQVAASVLEFVSIRVQGNDVILAFASVLGKTYRLERHESPAGSAGTIIQPAIPGTGGLQTITDPGAALVRSGFYRVAVVLP